MSAKREAPDVRGGKQKCRKESFKDVVQRMSTTADDPGIAIEYADDQTIHAGLQLAGSPIPPGINATASAAAFRAWIVGIITGIHAGCQVALLGGGHSDSHFDHLTHAEVLQCIMQVSLHSQWYRALDTANPPLSLGRWLDITAAGRGHCEMLHWRVCPFL